VVDTGVGCASNTDLSRIAGEPSIAESSRLAKFLCCAWTLAAERSATAAVCGAGLLPAAASQGVIPTGKGVIPTGKGVIPTGQGVELANGDANGVTATASRLADVAWGLEGRKRQLASLDTSLDFADAAMVAALPRRKSASTFAASRCACCIAVSEILLGVASSAGSCPLFLMLPSPAVVKSDARSNALASLTLSSSLLSMLPLLNQFCASFCC